MGNILRVLIVEDHPAAAEVFGKWVESAGHIIRICRTGVQAIREAETFKPQVVLLDIGLPDMDGWGLAQELRKSPGLTDPKIIAVSAYQSSEDKQRSKDAGIDYHLGKPASRREILELLEQAAQ
jgi:CheY-like chemotaxis protein